MNSSSAWLTQKRLSRELSKCADALAYFQVTVEAARRQPPQGVIEGYLRAGNRVLIAARMLATAVELVERSFKNFDDFDEVLRAYKYADLARSNAREANSIVLSSRIADDPEGWLRDRTYVDPGRHLLMEASIRLWKAAGDLEHRLRRVLADLAPAVAPVRGRPTATRPAKWISGSSIRILPVNYRLRYAEEFAAELNDFARLPRYRQVTLALRQASRAWLLCRALGGPILPIPARNR